MPDEKTTQIMENCEIGIGTIVRGFVNMYGCKIGSDCKISAFVEIQKEVTIGDQCKIEAFTLIPTGITIGNRVFIGPHVCFTNDKHPKAMGDWSMTPTIVEDDASIAANVKKR